MRALARWCSAHRRSVVIVWVLIAIATTAVATALGRSYTIQYSLPGTGSQNATDLLRRDFPAQSGDIDEIVFRVAHGTIDSAGVEAAIEPLLAKAATLRHVSDVISPYSPRGAVQVAADRRTAFATVIYDKQANQLPTDTGAPLLRAVHAVHVPGLEVAAGGQVVENAEGFNIGPATEVGVVAALIILLLTFGTLLAAGMPLITAGIGLLTGVAVIGVATHLTAVPSVAPDLALMIGLGVGIDYALFIVTRFREAYAELDGDVEAASLAAMDTSGRAILLAGSTVVIALLGMFATEVPFMYGLAVAAVIAVLLTLAASITLLPALLSYFGERVARVRAPGERRLGRRARRAAPAAPAPSRVVQRSAWRRWSEMVQARPWPLAIVSLAVMVALLLPVFAMRLDSSDAGNDPSSTTTYRAFNLLAEGFGPGFNGPLLLVAKLPPREASAVLASISSAARATPDVVAVTPPRIAPSGDVAVIEAYPGSAPQADATTDLVNRLRRDVLPRVLHGTGATVYVGGFTAGSIDFSNVLAGKLPIFFAIVIALSAVLLFTIFRSVIVPIQAALMNLLTIGAALGVTVAVFQDGTLASVIGVQKGPIEPWIPVILFAVVFGLSMDYEVFLVSRVREQWVRDRDASRAVADGIALTGRVISAAAAIMVCVFISFTLGDLRALKEFGFGLAVAVFLDAIVVRCVLLPATLELLGRSTWWLPARVDSRLPRIQIEGVDAHQVAAQRHAAMAQVGNGAGVLDGDGAPLGAPTRASARDDV